MSREAEVLRTSSQKIQSVMASLIQLRTSFWESLRAPNQEPHREFLPEDETPPLENQGDSLGPPQIHVLEDLIVKHQALRSHSSPFRSLAIGKHARPEARFKELPQASFGTTGVTLSLASK